MNSKGDRQGDLQHLERIFELMESHEVAQLEWEKSGERLKLKTRHAFMSPSPIVAPYPMAGMGMPQMASPPMGFPSMEKPAGASEPVVPAAGASKSATVNTNQKQVVSPFVGTFYRAPTPTADPYVKEGQAVKRGDSLCIIEAMKLMNEIEAEFPGKIISVLVENGQPVEFGEPLFIIEP
jgi:acetyl-CoA carboxylase biotin carboxyl carrier protein